MADFWDDAVAFVDLLEVKWSNSLMFIEGTSGVITLGV